MTITQSGCSTSANYIPVQAQLIAADHDTSARPPTIGRALADLAEAIQTAKRAGMTSAQMQSHLAVLWPVVPVEDGDDADV